MTSRAYFTACPPNSQYKNTQTNKQTKWLTLVFFFFFRYHTGSLAFGAAIIAIVQFIRAVLEYIDHKLKGVVIIY